MATSPYNDTVYVLDFLGELIWQKKASVLDVGAGFGRWGFLCRCHMGSGVSLTVQPDQALRIDAIEGFGGNISVLYSAVYNSIFEGDACERVPKMETYDVVICSHMIEHLEKEKGRELIRQMKERARMALILCLPLGEWPQDALGGNALEAHRSTWEADDFRDGETLVKVFGRKPLRNGVVIFPVSGEARWEVRVRQQPWRRTVSKWMGRVQPGS